MTDQNETPEFRPVGDGWQPCREPDGAPLELLKLGGQWWMLWQQGEDKDWFQVKVLMAQDGGKGRMIFDQGCKALPDISHEWSFRSGWRRFIRYQCKSSRFCCF